VAPAEKIFAAIVDLRGYDRWLERSEVFEGITDISSDPIAVGTTWSEPGPNGVRRGTVTDFEAPTRVTFHHPMTMSPRFLGIIDITVPVTLTQKPLSVLVRRSCGKLTGSTFASRAAPGMAADREAAAANLSGRRDSMSPMLK
jgi:uncharacterized protein YndB with AHSA1/START domain